MTGRGPWTGEPQQCPARGCTRDSGPADVPHALVPGAEVITGRSLGSLGQWPGHPLGRVRARDARRHRSGIRDSARESKLTVARHPRRVRWSGGRQGFLGDQKPGRGSRSARCRVPSSNRTARSTASAAASWAGSARSPTSRLSSSMTAMTDLA